MTVRQRIQQSIRQSDTAARMGGEEYSVLLRNIEDKIIDPQYSLTNP